MEVWAVPVAILTGAWVIARALEEGFKQVLKRLDRSILVQAEQLDRIGTKLDNLWSPLEGLKARAWNEPRDHE